jgi:hypothetical protein
MAHRRPAGRPSRRRRRWCTRVLPVVPCARHRRCGRLGRAVPARLPVARTMMLFAAEDALGVVRRRLDSICTAASADLHALDLVSSPRLPGASTRPTTRPGSWSNAGHSSRSTRSGCAARKPPVNGATHGLHKYGETTTLGCRAWSAPEQRRHRGADEVRPRSRCSKPRRSPRQLVPPQLSVVLVAAGTGDFLDRDQHGLFPVGDLAVDEVMRHHSASGSRRASYAIWLML